MNVFGYFDAGLVIFEDLNIVNMAAGVHLELWKDGHGIKLSA